MARLYKVIGLADNKVTTEVDGKITCTFDLKENIQANKVYESLDYHAGEHYELDLSERGDLDEQKYESCKAFFKQIIDKVNAAAVSNETNERTGEADTSYSDDAPDEDIPF